MRNQPSNNRKPSGQRTAAIAVVAVVLWLLSPALLLLLVASWLIWKYYLPRAKLIYNWTGDLASSDRLAYAALWPLSRLGAMSFESEDQRLRYQELARRPIRPPADEQY